MRLSPWTNRAVIAFACIGVAPGIAAAFPWRPAARSAPASNRPNVNRRQNAATGMPTITAVGDRLVITGDDPQKVALAYELARTLLSDKGQTYKAFRLQAADATEMAQVLDEWFNGTQPQAPVTNPIAAALLARAARNVRNARPAEPPPPPRVHIVADPTTNALLVRASALDLITVGRLIQSMDVESSDAPVAMKPFIIGPLKYAVATEVVSILKDVYQEDTNQTRGRSGRSRPRPQPLDPSGRPKPVLLSIAADDRTNSIVGMAPGTMGEDIRKVVAVIEEKSRTDDKAVQLVPSQGIDPILLEQVIEAVQARPTAPSASNRNGSTATGTRPTFGNGRQSGTQGSGRPGR
jgi:hypothetical protein